MILSSLPNRLLQILANKPKKVHSSWFHFGSYFSISSLLTHSEPNTPYNNYMQNLRVQKKKFK